ncbi:hypothetical protein N4G70_04695 [Streptomyces sp. ASQP_92]|uniref:hypothetical protein n=1 Tax=Streptomyces sp. ASQP_92 TaxID=2979116 RepID=UPI0021C0A291|nr:hypothetical protein [Streptomyces sp. ASQP_92]MCT9088159.1 hypothetical protein [Streptomyces sp. ASQP_92]
MDISGTQLRAARAALFTALVVTLSAASHVLLSRVPLPLSLVSAAAGAVFVIAYALAGRERGFWAIAGALVPLELAADTLFTTGQHVCYGPAGGPVAGALRAVGFDVLCGGGALGAVSGPADAATMPAHPGPAVPWLLLAAHLTLGLLAALWLRRGEAALARLLRAVGAFAFRPLLVAVAVVRAAADRPGPLARPAHHRSGPSPTRLLVHSLARRGPPRRSLGTV